MSYSLAACILYDAFFFSFFLRLLNGKGRAINHSSRGVGEGVSSLAYSLCSLRQTEVTALIQENYSRKFGIYAFEFLIIW